MSDFKFKFNEAYRVFEHDLMEEYEEMLNDSFDTVHVCGYNYNPGHALRILDEVVFREGFKEYIDGLVEDESLFESEEGNYYLPHEVEELE